MSENIKTEKVENLPKGWKRVRLGEVTEETFPGDWGEDLSGYKNIFPVFSTLAIDYNGKIDFSKAVLRKLNEKKLKKLMLTRGTILIEKSGGSTDTPAGKVAILREDFEGTCSNFIQILRVNKKVCNNFYLFYRLFYNFKNNLIEKYQQRTTGIINFILNDYLEEYINLPPLPEQHKIAEILETVDNAIEKTDAIIEKYKRIKKGLMADLLTGKVRVKNEGGKFSFVPNQKWKDSPLGKIPTDWEVVKLEEVAIKDGIVRGPFGGMLKKENFLSEGYKVYEQGNAIYKTINLGNYYIDRKKYKQMLRFAVKQNDFIISCSGTIGKICMIPQNFEEGVINQALLKITINDKKFDHKFFEYYFEWDAFQNKIIDYTQGGAMQNLIGINEFKKVNFPLPPLHEQQRIAKVLSQVDEVIEKELNYKEKLERIKKGLMEDLLTGKVRVNSLIKEGN